MSSIRRILFVSGVVLIMAAAVVSIASILDTPALAASITVDTTADELNADGDCSLREAIQAANTDVAVDACAAGSGADTITLPAGTYTIALAGTGEDANATGDFDIADDLTISGAGAATTIIDGADLDRVFQNPSSTVEFIGVTITDGLAPGTGRGGGIQNLGTFTLTESIVSSNEAFNGGGIANDSGGVFTLNNSTVTGNATTGNSGAGIVNSEGTLTINGSTISGNSTTGVERVGGGIAIAGGTVTIDGSTVSDNTTTGDGGGIWVEIGEVDPTVDVTITNSTISSNDADFDGGGIYAEPDTTVTLISTTVAGNTSAGGTFGSGGGGIANFGDVTIAGSAISGNTASDPGAFDPGGGGIRNIGTLSIDGSAIGGNTSEGLGGGIANFGSLTLTDSAVTGNVAAVAGGINTISGDASLTNVTVSGNIGDTFAGIANQADNDLSLTNVTITQNSPGAGLHNSGGPEPGQEGVVTMVNTIVAQNGSDDCTGAGTYVSLGHNIDSDDTCQLVAAGDQPATDPLLDPLALNAPGTTQTHALPIGSPAVDTGDDAACPAADQRGVTRPQDGDNNGTAVCDIGAYELLALVQTPTPTPSLTATPAELPETGGESGSGGSDLPWLILLTVVGSATVAGGALIRQWRSRI